MVIVSDEAVGGPRRDRLSAEGKCINGDHHGPPMAPQKRCAWCVQVHRVGSVKALELARENPENPQPTPNYRAKRSN